MYVSWCDRSFHCCSLQATVIVKVRDSCIRRESFMRILDYGPDSSPKLDQVIKQSAASETHVDLLSQSPACTHTHLSTHIGTDTCVHNSPLLPFSVPVSLQLSHPSVGNYCLSLVVTFECRQSNMQDAFPQFWGGGCAFIAQVESQQRNWANTTAVPQLLLIQNVLNGGQCYVFFSSLQFYSP